MHRRRAYVAVIALLAMLLVPAAAIAGGPLPPLADWRLDFGDLAASGVSDRHAGDLPDGAAGPRATGTWTISDLRFRGGILRLHVQLEPPTWALPVDAGPAVLFTTLDLGGGLGGDVGYQRVVSVQHHGLPACDPAACVFGADVSVDVRRLPRMARRVPGFESPRVAVAFTLVRSFAGGTWLQYLDAYDRDEASADEMVRTLRAPGGTWQGAPIPLACIQPR